MLKQAYSLRKQALATLALVSALSVPLAGFAQSQSAPVMTPSNTTTSTPSTTSAPITGTVHAPIRAGGVMAMDLPDSSAQSIALDIVKGRFSDYSVGRMTLTATGIDFKQGALQGLKAEIAQGNFDNLLVDKMTMIAPAFSFNTMELLNNHTFVLNQPVNAKVSLQISEAGINQFIANPKTMEKIEKSITRKTGGLKLVEFSNARFYLLSNSNVRMTVNTIVGQGMTVPLEMNGHIGLVNGQIAISDMKVTSSDNKVQLPFDVSTTFQDKINDMIDFKKLGKNSLIITADSMKLTGKTMNIEGHAQLTKLKFG